MLSILHERVNHNLPVDVRRAFLGVSSAIDEVWHNDGRIHKQEIYTLDGKF